MTGRATFGDFAAAATTRLRELDKPGEWPARGVGSLPATELVDGMRAAVNSLAGYADDARRAFDMNAFTGTREFGSWARAACEASQILANLNTAWTDAASISTAHPTRGDLPGADWRRRRAGGLHSAALPMTLGRDLLQTHFGTRRDQKVMGESEWSSVLNSAPLARALLHQTGGWTRQLGALASRAAALGRGLTVADRDYLIAAHRGLLAASWAIGAAQEQHPARRDELALLASVPVSALPSGGMPPDGATVHALCEGVLATAERLRSAARRAAQQAAWSPLMTRESLRHTAGCCAVAASNVRLLLRTLAADRAGPCALANRALADAAAAADDARATWLRVAEAWDVVTTDTRSTMNPVAAEASALALWTGRLAYASPAWTPAIGPQHAPRSAAELAPSPDGLRQVVDALHYTCHTLTAVADADRAQARLAAMNGRLIVPTRSLPDGFDVPYRFAPAPATRVEPLLFSYDLAADADNEATAAVGQIAADVKAPSRVLTTYRAVLRTKHDAAVSAPGLTTTPEAVPDARLATSASRLADFQTQSLPPGPVERILLDLDVTSRSDLNQAIALDTAADVLILRAAVAARPRSDRDLSRSAGTAELVSHLFAASKGGLPEALRPEPRAPRQSLQSSRPQRRELSGARARDAEPEASA